jgi:hypothetical protein
MGKTPANPRIDYGLTGRVDGEYQIDSLAPNGCGSRYTVDSLEKAQQVIGQDCMSLCHNFNSPCRVYLHPAPFAGRRTK